MTPTHAALTALSLATLMASSSFAQCPTPVNYCSTSPNSVGAGALMSWTGTPSITADDFHLVSTGCPPGQFLLIYYGAEQASIPFGNGFRCVGGAGVRLPVINSDFAGDAAFDPDLTNLPPGGQIDPGSTWNFQYWFRDPVAGGANFDFTDAVQIDFCP